MKKNLINEIKNNYYYNYIIKGLSIAFIIISLYGMFYIGGISACVEGNGEAYKDGIKVVCYNTDDYVPQQKIIYDVGDDGGVYYGNSTYLLV